VDGGAPVVVAGVYAEWAFAAYVHVRTEARETARCVWTTVLSAGPVAAIGFFSPN